MHYYHTLMWNFNYINMSDKPYVCRMTCGRSVGFFRDTLVSSIIKTDRHDITEMLLKMALNTITITITLNMLIY